ncbi:MAG: GxxExxY protein, partial [Planctomycetales bacterium]|nr:GxxExxY protein [Planctomycetales bacterium]
TWEVVKFTVQRKDGGIVDAELLRPRSWIEANDLQVGRLLPIDIEELQIEGYATVTAIESSPAIASGEGSAVTGRFITRRVDEICRIEVLGAEGQIDTIEGTTIHPIWSLDRSDWVPLGKLQEGEQLLGASGAALILTHAIVQRNTPVYNIEVHGEHVYQVGESSLLVHNQCHHIVSHYANANRGFAQAWSQMGQRILTQAGIGVHSLKNKINLLQHKGPHPELYHQRVFERLEAVTRRLTPYTPAFTNAVETELGPGLLESAYEQCLAHELSRNNIAFQLQLELLVRYKDGARISNDSHARVT